MGTMTDTHTMAHTYKHETHRAFTLGILYQMLLLKDTTLNNTINLLLTTKNRLNKARLWEASSLQLPKSSTSRISV